MEMRGQAPPRIGEQRQQRVVDLGRLDGREPDADRHGVQQQGAELRQRGARLQIPAVVPDVDAGDHKFGMDARQRPGFSHHVGGRARDGSAASQSSGAERALAVAPVLDLEPGPGASLIAQQGPVPGRRRTEGRIQRREVARQRPRVLSRHHAVHLRHAPVVVLAQGGRTARHQDARARVLPPQPAHQPAGFGIRLVGDRAGVHHQRIRLAGPSDGAGAPDLQLLAHALGVVLVGPAPEGVEPDGGFACSPRLAASERTGSRITDAPGWSRPPGRVRPGLPVCARKR